MSRIDQRQVVFAFSNPMQPECSSRSFTSMARPSCPDKPTTSMSSRRSVWPCLHHRPRESRTRCLSNRRAVADQVPDKLLKQGLLFPLQSNILETEIQTAARVAEFVFDSGLARVELLANMVKFIRKHVYKPEYAPVLAPAFQAA